jgi:hypothetical protein
LYKNRVAAIGWTGAAAPAFARALAMMHARRFHRFCTLVLIAAFSTVAFGSSQTQPATTAATEPAATAPATTAPSTAPATAPTTAPAATTAPATVPAAPPPPVLRLHIGAVADESSGQPKPQLSGPPPQIIRLILPPQIVSQWAGMLPQDNEVMLKNVAFDLHPTPDGVFRIDQGVMGFHSQKGSEIHGYEIEFQNTMATLPAGDARHYAGLVIVHILPDRRFVFALEATMKVAPGKWSGGGMDAVDADVVWTGPLSAPAPSTQPAK